MPDNLIESYYWKPFSNVDNRTESEQSQSQSLSGLPARPWTLLNMTVFVDQDWRSDLIQKWEFFYFDSMDGEKTNRVTFNDEDEIFEVKTEHQALNLFRLAQQVKRKNKRKVFSFSQTALFLLFSFRIARLTW